MPHCAATYPQGCRREYDDELPIPSIILSTDIEQLGVTNCGAQTHLQNKAEQ